MCSPWSELRCKYSRLRGTEGCTGRQTYGSCQSCFSGPDVSLFIGSIPTHSEIKLANSYFYDKAMCLHAWKLFLPEDDFSLDHTASNPLIPGRETPLKCMPPTLTVVAEHDWMRDRAIAYSEELRKVNVDAPVLDYKDAVHEFPTLDMLLRTPQAQACTEDIAIWVKKCISQRGHEFSY